MDIIIALWSYLFFRSCCDIISGDCYKIKVSEMRVGQVIVLDSETTIKKIEFIEDKEVNGILEGYK